MQRGLLAAPSQDLWCPFPWEAPIKLAADFSTETFQAKVKKSKDLQLRLLYIARLSFKIEGEIKSFSDKKKLKEFILTKPELQKKKKKKRRYTVIKNKMAINIYHQYSL